MPFTRARWKLSILLVEDNPTDIRLIGEALRQASLDVDVAVVHDGAAAISYLRKLDGYRDARRPDLIFLDLNLPKRDGREVLAEIKGDEDLHSIPVVVLTTSDAARDVVEAYEHRANCYVRKPFDLDQFLHVVRECERFWLHVARLPAPERPAAR